MNNQNTHLTQSNLKNPVILSSLQNHVLTVSINRLEKKNAITREMYTLLYEALMTAGSNKDIRAVVICGHPDCFTAGNDISDFLNHPPADESSPVLLFLRALSQFEKPLVAAANGPAVGIGTTLLLHCDYVVLGPDAYLKLPFVELGLCPEAASSLLLPRMIGYLRASEMILTSTIIQAEKALNWGLANEINDNCIEQAQSVAQKMSRLPLKSLVLSKQLLKREINLPVDDRLSVEAALFVKQLRSPEAKEAFSAFLEKRAADFTQFC